MPLALAQGLFALLRFRAEGEPDLGWHLAQGRLLAEGSWLRSNALAWTAPAHPWVDTSWLFDLLAYASTRVFPALLGPKLLTALFFALTLLFLGLAALELTPLGAWLLPALALLLVPKSTPRPHLAGWASLACVLWLCLRAQRLEQLRCDRLPSQPSAAGPPRRCSRPDRLRALALLPIWICAQLHAGAAFSLAPLGFFTAESLWRRARAAAGIAPRAALFTSLPLLLAPLALLAGPAGPASVVHLLRHWQLGQVVSIQEFQPWSFAAEPLVPAVAACALLGLWLARGPISPAATSGARAVPDQPALLATTLLFLCLALRTVRFAYELFVVSAPALALLIEALRLRQGTRAARLALACSTLACLLPHHLVAALGAARFEAGWNPRALPVRAARFLEEHRLEERGFNGLRDGGYLAWARPGVPVFIDARIHAYPDALWRALESGCANPAAFDRFLREEGVTWALTTRQRERLGNSALLAGQPGWALVEWDETSALYLRRDQPQLAGLIAASEYRRFHPWGDLFAETEQAPRAELAALDAELARFLTTSPGDATALLLGCLSARRQASGEAAARCAQASAAIDAAGDPALETLLRRTQSF